MLLLGIGVFSNNISDITDCNKEDINVERIKIKYKKTFFHFLKLREVEGGVLGIITAVLQPGICMQEGPARGNI